MLSLTRTIEVPAKSKSKKVTVVLEKIGQGFTVRMKFDDDTYAWHTVSLYPDSKGRFSLSPGVSLPEKHFSLDSMSCLEIR